MPSLALPSGYAPYLRYDLAYFDLITVSGSAGGTLNLVTVPGHYWLRVLTCWITDTPFDSLSVRIPFIGIRDDRNVTVFRALAPAGQQNTSLNHYIWITGLGAAYGTLNNPQTAPFPDILIPSGWILILSAVNVSNGDTYGTSYLLVQKIPTGPRLDVDLPVRVIPNTQIMSAARHLKVV